MRLERRAGLTARRGFQSPHPRRVRHLHKAMQSVQYRFQSPHPRRVRLIELYRLFDAVEISIPAPTKGATPSIHLMAIIGVISIPAPTKGATPSIHLMAIIGVVISIPAPTKGATFSRISLSRITIDFNPRTHEGCDSFSRIELQSPDDFNPRTHEGCDLEFFYRSFRPRSISIPAPTKGATRSSFCLSLISPHFNPRTHEGCDRFNEWYGNTHGDFNPRTHEGCDTRAYTAHLLSVIFQSPHPRRVRLTSVMHMCYNIYISIPAPTKGAT